MEGAQSVGRGHRVFAFKASAQNRVLKFLALVCYQQRLLVCVGVCVRVYVYVCLCVLPCQHCRAVSCMRAKVNTNTKRAKAVSLSFLCTR